VDQATSANQGISGHERERRNPDGHFKLPHFWALKFPQGGTPRLSL
jgi:hypothetical protein